MQRDKSRCVPGTTSPRSILFPASSLFLSFFAPTFALPWLSFLPSQVLSLQAHRNGREKCKSHKCKVHKVLGFGLSLLGCSLSCQKQTDIVHSLALATFKLVFTYFYIIYMFAFKLFTLVVVCEAHEADICTPESMRADMLSLVPRLPGEDAFRLSMYYIFVRRHS